MNQQEMKDRTRSYSLRIIRLCQALPNEYVAQRLGDQLLRAGTSVGANYRTACRARSPKEFIARLGIVEEETDESMYWMELLVDADIVREERLRPLLVEGNEILSIIVATLKTAKQNQGR